VSILDPSFIDPRLDSRAVTFENPTGARGAGGMAHGGRKGAPNRTIKAGEAVELADIEGPGVVRHIWMTFPPAPPEQMRAITVDVYYDGAHEPSISVPCLDFFGMPLGRPVAHHSALTAAQEGRGFNSYIPMPFRRSIRFVLRNGAPRAISFYYQLDYTLEPDLAVEQGYLHVSFRRQNPTVQLQDFVIDDGLVGPGRFLGCNIGIRVIDPAAWYGEGEVKVFRDGDTHLPTICGTGLEDYVGSAWGLGAHCAPYGGAPLVIGGGADNAATMTGNPDLVGFYRWHVPDPIMFEGALRVTIQQIGAAFFFDGQEDRFEAYARTNPAAGEGWNRNVRSPLIAWGIAERVDDYCATSYVYCRQPQPVPPLDVAAAIVDIERRDYETASPLELMGAMMDSDDAARTDGSRPAGASP
jgi:hypothetical protein